MSETSRVLEVLADLAGSDRGPSISSVDPDLLEWLPLSYTNLLRGEPGRRSARAVQKHWNLFESTDRTRRILKTAQLRSAGDGDDVLRVGWLWLAGRHPTRGQVLTPLMSLPAKRPLRDHLGKRVFGLLGAEDETSDIVAAGEPELTDLIVDEEARQRLGVGVDLDPAWADEPEISAPSSDDHDEALRTWAVAAAAAAGCVTKAVVAASRPPARFRRNDQLIVVAGLGLYVAPSEARRPVTAASTLRAWARQDIDDTALAAVYGDTTRTLAAGVSPAAVSPFQLNTAQRGTVAVAAAQRLTVLSGPPGTGKTQTVAAVAFDQVRRGKTVLVVAPSNASVTALTTLMEQTPGPDPVVFGASAHRLEVASQLAERVSTFHDDELVAQRLAEHERAASDAGRLRSAIETLLADEHASSVDPAAVMLSRAEAPGLFEHDADLDAAAELWERAARLDADDLSWWRRRRAARARDRLRSMSRASSSESVAMLGRHVELARAQRRRAELEASGGLDLTPLWQPYIEASTRHRLAAGALLDAAVYRRDRADRSSQRAITAVATALRSGRRRRRELLADVDSGQLLEPLPLWVSTLRDVDDLLPMHAGMFDLVIIDEASHIDQVGAAPALLRAKSALIVGDPRQLRHVSFVSTERIDAALDTNGLSDRPVAAQLEVQRKSIFDAAASVEPPLLLDEHYRSSPHLIEFSAARFYGGRLGVATRHPANEQVDCIRVVEAAGIRDSSGVNEIEIEVIVEMLRRDLEEHRGSVGVVTPFRAQADALETACRDAFELGEIERLDLRVGTVHGFQGCQRDVMYLSMCLDDDAPAGSRTFVDDPALFNVMVTRARRSVVVVTSTRALHPALLADYLRHADLVARSDAVAAPASPPRTGWAGQVLAELTDAGLDVRTSYAVGRHEIDAVIGSGGDALAVVCGVHPAGPAAHIDRHVELRALGWTIREVFATAWHDRLPGLAVDLYTSHGEYRAGDGSRRTPRRH